MYVLLCRVSDHSRRCEVLNVRRNSWVAVVRLVLWGEEIVVYSSANMFCLEFLLFFCIIRLGFVFNGNFFPASRPIRSMMTVWPMIFMAWLTTKPKVTKYLNSAYHHHHSDYTLTVQCVYMYSLTTIWLIKSMNLSQNLMNHQLPDIHSARYPWSLYQCCKGGTISMWKLVLCRRGTNINRLVYTYLPFPIW